MNRFWHNYCSYIYIARILILRDGRELKLKHKIILISCLALVSSFLFAGEIINQNKVDTSTPITETESENLIQQTSIDIFFEINSSLNFLAFK